MEEIKVNLKRDTNILVKNLKMDYQKLLNQNQRKIMLIRDNLISCIIKKFT